MKYLIIGITSIAVLLLWIYYRRVSHIDQIIQNIRDVRKEIHGTSMDETPDEAWWHEL